MGFLFFQTFFNPWFWWVEWGMLHQIWDGQDVLSQERRREPGVNMKTGPYGEKGVWSNGRSVSALQRQGETETKKHI